MTRGLPDPPRFYLRNCHVVVKPYGWCPLDTLAAELQWLAPDVYRDLSGPLAGLWLVQNDVMFTYRKLHPDDTEDTPSVGWHDIDAEIRRRTAAKK